MTGSIVDGMGAGGFDRQVALADEWDELVEQVRRLDGFADFLRPPAIDALRPAAADGPIVILTVDGSRGTALIMTANGVQVEPLPNLSAAALLDTTTRYLRALQAVDQAARVFDRVSRLADTGQRAAATRDLQIALAGRDQGLTETLGWLWETIAGPVLDRLGLGRPTGRNGPWPRLWWCPTGLLTLLPLHAAGYHEDADRRRTVIDRVVSSYTPTVRALIEARRPGPAAGADRILVVCVDDVPGEAPLPAVGRERDMLVSLLPDRHTVLTGDRATLAQVRAELVTHRWVHFSCHGSQNLHDPSQGGLLLRDARLNIADISALPFRGEFAFLCACQTATGGLVLPDEAISLSAALHYAGYRHVIGALWSVYDQVAADIAEAVYRHLAIDGALSPQRSATALHHAIRRLRDNSGYGPSAWTPFVHIGP